MSQFNNGHRRAPGTTPIYCQACGGTGQRTVRCGACGGSGYKAGEKFGHCPACGGCGYVYTQCGCNGGVVGYR